MGDNIVTSADDMEFFKTILKYMGKMQPVDNFDFCQAMMVIIRKYCVHNDPGSAGVARSFQSQKVKEELLSDNKEKVMREISQNTPALGMHPVRLEHASSSKGMQESSFKVEKHPMKAELLSPRREKQVPIVKEEAREIRAMDRHSNPFFNGGIIEIEDSDSDVADLETHIVTKKARIQ